MVKVKYDGMLSSCRVRVSGDYINNWKKGEVKDLPKKSADKLIKNPDFKLVEEKKKEVKKEEPKQEEPVMEDTYFGKKEGDYEVN